MDLERLIDEASVLAGGRDSPRTGRPGMEEPTRYKPVQPEPGEPDLIGQTAPIVAGNFRRRLEQRNQAMERRLAFARAMVSTGWDEQKSLAMAGYSPTQRAVKSAVQALMAHPDVITEIQRLRLVLEQKADVATIDLAKEWVGIASSDVFDYFNETVVGDGVVALQLKPKNTLSKGARKAVKAIKIRRNRRTSKDGDTVETEDIEVTLWDKQAALDSLAKIQGLYADKTAEAIDGLAMKIAERTERHRKRIGQTIEATAEAAS